MTIFSYIDLTKTNYTVKVDARVLSAPNVNRLLEIWDDYCVYKKFPSQWPYYAEQFYDMRHDIIGYFDNNELVAWSMIYKINEDVCEAIQFAWDYKNPRLHLGLASLRAECAIYKEKGYKTFMLGEAHEYKKQLSGFSIYGPPNG